MSKEEVLGILAQNNHYELTQEQRNAWLIEIGLLQEGIQGLSGLIFLEFAIPRMGKRVDAILLVGNGIFVIEFKVGSNSFEQHAIDQVVDYALDLKNFHEGSASRAIFPILWATQTKSTHASLTAKKDNVFHPMLVSSASFRPALDLCLKTCYSFDTYWHTAGVAQDIILHRPL